MQSLNTGYTVYFNLRHGRHGHLLDGRYKAQLVARDEYLLKLSRYVHQSPVCVASWAKRPLRDRVERMRAWCGSSYRGYIGADEAFEFVDEGPILAMMAGGAEAFEVWVDEWLIESKRGRARGGSGSQTTRKPTS